MALPILAVAALAGMAANAASKNSSEAKAHNAIQNAEGTLSGAQSYIENAKNANTGLAQQGYDLAGSLWDPNGDISQKYQDALTGVENLHGYDADNLFEYDKSISDFYDPAFQLSVNMANDAINNSQATSGNMFSSDTANKLAAKNNVLATQMYNDARDAMSQDKSLEQSIWAGNESAKQAAAQSASNIAGTKLNAYGTGMSNLSDAQQNYINSMMGINSDYAGDMTDYLGSMANLQASDPGTKSVFQRVLDPLGLFG